MDILIVTRPILPPWDEGSKNLFPTYIVLTIYCLFLTILMFRKWRERRNKNVWLGT